MTASKYISATRLNYQKNKDKKMKKNILITGSTDGIGKLAATKLAQLGHNVYLHGRDASKLADVIAEVKLELPNLTSKPISK